jgi:catechol 2,3-dioxygenase-like lactoylglutathione lyase family enzyme
VRDLQQARRFWIDVMGAEPLPDRTTELRVADITVRLDEAEGGWTRPGAEYPHYGFRYRPDDMAPMREQVRACGIPTGEIWTRHQVEGLMYFRDPSGNLLETACWQGLDYADRLPLSRQSGGDYTTDLTALSYTRDAGDQFNPAQIVRPTQLDHLSLPVRDREETARFWVDVMGATLGRAPSHMIVIAGIDISFNAVSGGWTADDADSPRYAFAVEPEDLVPLREHIASFGIPAGEICTYDGQDASVYVRDPAGNLFELYCEAGFTGDVRRTPSAGGGYQVDVRALTYDHWTNPAR